MNICWDKSTEFLNNNAPEIKDCFDQIWDLTEIVFQEYAWLYLSLGVKYDKDTSSIKEID